MVVHEDWREIIKVCPTTEPLLGSSTHNEHYCSGTWETLPSRAPSCTPSSSKNLDLNPLVKTKSVCLCFCEGMCFYPYFELKVTSCLHTSQRFFHWLMSSVCAVVFSECSFFLQTPNPAPPNHCFSFTNFSVFVLVKGQRAQRKFLKIYERTLSCEQYFLFYPAGVFPFTNDGKHQLGCKVLQSCSSHTQQCSSTSL